MEVLAILLGVWMIGIFLTWPFFWAKRTNRSQTPIMRRGIGLAYAIVWPIVVIAYFAGRGKARQRMDDQRAAHERILGGGSPSAPPSASSGPQITNPFDA